MNLIGKTIAGRYEVIEKTGVGGMATVYVAKDTVLNRFVAIKVLKEEFTTDEEFIKRFNTEALAAASLTHANIVSIYDVGNEDNVYYIVMELVRGKTLKQIITEEGAISWKWAINIAIQIASALEVAHKNNIVHRDIKPHNIIITEDGVAKVTDFGIAKAVSNSTITAFGTTIGSVHYFSPEQAKGGYTDAKSDIYSLGVVMYEMLTGKVPFDADTSVSVALKHMQEEPTEPIEINEEIPSSLNDIVMKAMSKEPMARYQSATSMIRDLEQALKDPDGDFVEENSFDDGLTRRMDAVTDDMIDKTKKVNGRRKKKEGFFTKHPKLKIPFIILVCIILFAASLGITSLAMNLSNPKEVQIPNLVNKTEDEAKEELSKIKVKYNKIGEEYSTEVEVGKIISQDPPYLENYKIKEKTTINVVVSKGTETTTVPKVVGMKVNEATKALEDAKLKVEKIEESSKTVESGVVIAQDTDADTKVNAGDIVTIHVSTGTPKAQVPSLIGKTESEAKSALSDAGLSVEVEYSSDTSKGNGVVVSQSINEGKKVELDTTVTITVNKFTETKDIYVTVNISKLVGADNSNTNTTEENKSKSVTLTVSAGDKSEKRQVKTTDSECNVTLSGVEKKSLSVRVEIGNEYSSSKTVGADETSVSF